MTDIVERLSVAWEKQPGAAMTKINRILVERKDAIAEITRLRQLLSEAEKREREVRAKALEEAASRVDAKADSYQAEARDVRGNDRDRRFYSSVANRLRGASADIRALQSEER